MEDVPQKRIYQPLLSIATPVTGPRCASILTKGFFTPGLHSVTVPGQEEHLLTSYIVDDKHTWPHQADSNDTFSTQHHFQPKYLK